MSREASTSERTEEIINNLTSPNIKAEAYLEVDNQGSWVKIDDIDFETGIKWTEAGKNEKYNNFSLTSLPGTVAFRVVNFNGNYFPGSGSALANFFDLDTKIRLRAGYVLSTGATSTETISLNDVIGIYVRSFFYRTEHSAGTVILDSDDSTTPIHFTDLWTPLYDSETYDDSTYSPDAYTVHTHDAVLAGLETFTSISVTANTTNGTIYYRTFNDPFMLDESVSTDWTNAGSLVNGTKTVDFTDIEDQRYIQIGIVFDGVGWGDGTTISNISVSIITRFEEIYRSVYYLDRPRFTDPKIPNMPMVICSGRDIFKRAIGVDIKYSDINGLEIDDIIKSVCDKVGIGYNSTSIADLSAFNTRTTFSIGNSDVIKADKLLDQCMQIINTSGYVMYTEYEENADDNILYVQLRPQIEDTVGAFSYKNYESIGDVSKNPGKILQRMTVLSDNKPTESDSQLDTLAISTTGSKSLTWTGEAEYKRIEVDIPGNITISNLSVNPTSITFTVDSVTGTVNVTAFGNKWQGRRGSVTATVTNREFNDFDVRGDYVGGEDRTYEIEIDATGTPDTFKWRQNAGTYTTGVAITSSWYSLGDGLQIKFGNTTGHTLADKWDFPVTVNPPVYEGEAIDWDNMALLDGTTSRLVNPLILSDAECKTIAESFVTEFGTPVFEARGLVWPYMNLIPELNDAYMLWRRWVGGTSADEIYIITKIEHHYDKSKQPNMFTTFSLEDSGSKYSDLGTFIYDSIVDWDKGFVWDMGISDPQDSPAEIDAATTIVNNVDFV
jgi:hypothetical protein